MNQKQVMKDLDEALSAQGTSDWQRELLGDMKSAVKQKQKRVTAGTRKRTPKKAVKPECPKPEFVLGEKVYTLYGDYPKVLYTWVKYAELDAAIGRNYWRYKLDGIEELVPAGAIFPTLIALESMCRGCEVLDPKAPAPG